MDLNLYLRRNQAGHTGSSIGRLIMGDVDSDANRRCFILRGEFIADAAAANEEQPPYWVRLEASLRTQLEPCIQVDSVTIEHNEQPPFPPVPLNRMTTFSWQWKLLPEDVETIEAVRQHQPQAPVYLQLAVEGIVQTAKGVFGVEGASQIKIELSQWQRLLESIGYNIRPSGLAALVSAVGHASWRGAAKRLPAARQHLTRGETRAALEACLSQLESVVSGPYKSEAWKARLAAMPDQKADSLSKWLSGLGTDLNRVGHHRSRSDRDAAGDLLEMPLDHWEAELVVASTQFALAYVLRLPAPTTT